MLSFDLHVHPGTGEERWGDGQRIWAAAKDSGVLGFVWKDHDRHTDALARDLPGGVVTAIGSASLNPWSTLDDVILAVENGARWIWGPTKNADGAIAWDLRLPAYWPDLVGWLATLQRSVMLATGHLGVAGRAAFAETAAANQRHLCSITHSLLLEEQSELEALKELDCHFEIDAFTMAVSVQDKRLRDLRSVLSLADDRTLVYLTSDGGQASTGDPFRFAASCMEELAGQVGWDEVERLGVTNPTQIIERMGL